MKWLDWLFSYQAKAQANQKPPKKTYEEKQREKWAARHPQPRYIIKLIDGVPRAIGGAKTIKQGACQVPDCPTKCQEHERVFNVGSHEVCKCGHVLMLHIVKAS